MVDPHSQLPGIAHVWNAATARLVSDIDAVLAAKPTDREALVALRLAIAAMLESHDLLPPDPPTAPPPALPAPSRSRALPAARKPSLKTTATGRKPAGSRR